MWTGCVTTIFLWLEPLGGALLAFSAKHSGPMPSWGPPTHSPAGSCPCPGSKESACPSKSVTPLSLVLSGLNMMHHVRAKAQDSNSAWLAFLAISHHIFKHTYPSLCIWLAGWLGVRLASVTTDKTEVPTPMKLTFI